MKRIYEMTPPEKLERVVLDAFPELGVQAEHMLGLKSEVRWPDWCWLPMAGAYAIVTGGADVQIARRYMANAGIDMYRYVAAIIPWRLYKPIYRFDPDLAAELTDRESFPDDVPVEVLYHMPYPCVYIENPPGLEDEYDGVFCFLEWDYRYPDATELRMHYLAKDGNVVAIYLHWTENKALLYSNMQENERRLVMDVGAAIASGVSEQEYAKCAKQAYRHLNLLLYLCSDEPDVERRQPEPRRRARVGVPVASYPDRLDVGTYIGAVMRKGLEHEAEKRDGTAGTMKRPHMRRAHWHLYWTGEGREIPRVKWISPVFVNARDSGPDVVIRPVK